MNKREELQKELARLDKLKKQVTEQLESLPKLEIGKWYKYTDHYDKRRIPIIAVFSGVEEGDNFGFDFYGNWCNDIALYHKKIGGEIVEANPEEVKKALIEEAEKRYKVGDKIEKLEGYYYGDFSNEISIVFEQFENHRLIGKSSNDFYLCLFKDGKWAQVIEYKSPKIGDVVKAWDNDEDKFVIGVLYNNNEYYRLKGFNYGYNSAKTLTQKEVIDLLF